MLSRNKYLGTEPSQAYRTGFRRYWAMLCKARKRVGGGRRIPKQIRELIFQMVVENPSWGAPRIHGELLMLGFEVSETTISRWMRRAPRNPEPAKRWQAFLRNHQRGASGPPFPAKREPVFLSIGTKIGVPRSRRACRADRAAASDVYVLEL